MTHHQFRAAAVQAAPVFLDLDASIDKAIGLIEDASRAGAELIAFRDLPARLSLVHLARRTGMGFSVHAALLRQLTGVRNTPGSSNCAGRQDNHIMVVMGLSERYKASLYIAQWIIDAEGKTVAMRRKLKPTHVERTVYGEGDGSDLSVYDTDLGRVGALCCWEHLQPLSKYAMYAQNEQVHIGAWPSFSLYTGAAYALGPEVNTAASRIYAVEGGCFVISPCATVSPR